MTRRLERMLGRFLLWAFALTEMKCNCAQCVRDREKKC